MRINGNVADLILAQLAEWGVERIYGVLGDAIFPLLDAISRQDKIKFIAVTGEVHAAFMSSYEARLTGKLSVCAASAGPGAVSLLNGLADAFMDGSPVLAITGQVESKEIGAGVKQYFDQQALFSSFVEQTNIAVEPGSVLSMLVAAVRTAKLNNSVAHTSIPKDVFAKAVSIETMSASFVEINSAPFVSGSLDNILQVVQCSQKPLIIAGRMAKIVKEQVFKLVDLLGAGLIVAREAKGKIAGQHELNLGGIGKAYLPPVLHEADCIIIIGAASYEREFIPQGTSVIQINDRFENIYQNTVESISGNTGLILENLLQRLDGHSFNRDWLEEIKRLVQNRRQELAAESANNTKPISPLRLMLDLNNIMPGEAIIALDIGEFTHWFNLGFQGEQQEILLSGRWRSIGCGLPAAIGAKFACPKKPVIAMVGDGGFIASMSELLTCVRYSLDICVIIVKNHIYSIEKNKMLAEGLIPSGYELTVPDFVQFAKSCGAEGYRIDDPADIQNTIRAALELGKPALVEVICADN
ncbi:MAG: putative thiamine pyrophosphate-containing protein YdaP [Pelotomaculum sp. PtaB.Bin013]|uniref:Thiamine pyrophosphate-binding protein n=1 Tax=Pelotomaculum isophthalicicum JI TaxID=947010 RepID=A0A9X4H449_9FIRM|nr:thiamine pyrophosphate-binding protein [Pelotomaculum isophthalicicum]MDF9408463.1 thiamine pyrophosphate-binding protein [Pelotomaculum isophthalicicum JI]OPX83020.1 MAG: putative thiamine pyrophosphate-containing protein YdaP [Pelotomaculum sp. PtaB.Bin013]